jgi:hypothetical protein
MVTKVSIRASFSEEGGAVIKPTLFLEELRRCLLLFGPSKAFTKLGSRRHKPLIRRTASKTARAVDLAIVYDEFVNQT